MHVLTKVFIVLVSLMAVLLVPLVVVYSHNEDSYKAKYQEQMALAQSQSRLAQGQIATANQRADQLEAVVQSLEEAKRVLQQKADQQVAEIRQLETELAEHRSAQTDTQARLATIASAVDASGRLTESLITELRDLRGVALESQQQVVELDAALRDVTAQLDVAVAARRALMEELQRLKDEHAQAMDTIGRYRAQHGDIGGTQLAAGELQPDQNVQASVTSIERGGGRPLVEINVGSRDGVKVGWVFHISRGGNYLGKLVIEEVDINRSVGKLSLEEADQRVQKGDQASAFARR